MSTDINNGLEAVLSPLKIIKIPVGVFAMLISLTLRFIPTLMEETERIYKAQASRGLDFKHGSITKKVRGVIALIIPLFVSSFAISDDLALVLEARGYNPRANRTVYRQLHWTTKDSITLILINIIMISVIVMSATHFDFMKILFNNIY